MRNYLEIMQNGPNINLDDLVQQIHILYPLTVPKNEESDSKIRRKLEEQLIQKSPQVELEQLDLKYIIMNVKRSLSEFQKRIDESVAEQQIRRTGRVRKQIHQDPAVLNFFNRNKLDRKVFSSATIKSDSAPTCSNSKCCHKISELSEIVQVESLPISASTNLLTIFIPSILQEKLHSCKYKISIDLNRLDLTKQILDLNVEQVNSKQEQNNVDITTRYNEADEKCSANVGNELKVTCGIKDDLEKKVETVATNTEVIPYTTSTDIKETQSENAVTALESPVELTVDAETLVPTTEKKRGRKRSEPKMNIKGPPKKRGRKPGSKNKKKDEKSELAKYVEMFACNATSPSGVSQIVTSTTQSWDVPQENGQIAYLMNGEWTLNAPSNNRLVSTTNNVMNLDECSNGQETYIPFEDFVNFIENPSLDVGNNFIARVLDGSAETGPSNVNQPELDAVKFSVEIPLNAKSNINSEVKQPIISTSTFDGPTESMFKQCNDSNMVHSTANDNEINMNSEILDLSKDNILSKEIGVLDLTRDKAEKSVLPSAFDHNLEQTNNEETIPVIFSTNRSMPSLDDIDSDLFCSPHRSENAEKSVIFSTQPSGTSFAANCLRSPNDSIADSAIEVERKNTPLKQNNDKTKPDLMKGMSLLEIERNIDDSMLDFDNCMDDDLLSLAPSSCFNSPTEDRFAESSMLKPDPTNVRPSIPTNSSAGISPEESYRQTCPPIKKKDEDTLLRNFRIPRKESKEDTSDTEQHSANKFCGAVDLGKNSNMDTYMDTSTTHSRDRIKILISCDQSNITIDRNPTIKTILPVSAGDVPKIFGPLCYNFLIDKCSAVVCKLSHQLLEPTSITTSLVHLPNDVLHSSYRFIWRHYKLFTFYFPIFCEEYARRNMRRKLSNMITDCEMQHNCEHFLKKIYSALKNCGLNRVNACRFILNRTKNSSSAEIDVIMDMIIESGAAMFSAAIEQYALIPSYSFKMKDINALASACLHSGSAELITVLIKCLINVDQVEFVTYRSSELIQILDMIKNGGVSGL